MGCSLTCCRQSEYAPNSIQQYDNLIAEHAAAAPVVLEPIHISESNSDTPFFKQVESESDGPSQIPALEKEENTEKNQPPSNEGLKLD